MSLPIVVGVYGPTACRKSELALDLAIPLKGEIINCDSVQVYKEVQIGANKPTEDEIKKVKHHLFSFVSPPDEYTAGRYSRDFHRIISSKSASTYFMVGGSNFYVRAAIKGLYPVEPSQPDRRRALEEEWNRDNGESLFRWLNIKDPEYAEKIGPKDKKRIVRAVEILKNSSFSSIAQIEQSMEEQPKAFEHFGVVLFRERQRLRQIIMERTERMLSSGLVEEVEKLLKRGLESWGPMKSVGYFETVRFLRGEYDMNTLKEEIYKNTARLAKRQMTWLRSDKNMKWFDVDQQWNEAREFVTLTLKELANHTAR